MEWSCETLNEKWKNDADRKLTSSVFIMQGNYSSGAAYTFVLLVTFWILFSYLVPISLFVSMEIVKFWQGFVQMQGDDEM